RAVLARDAVQACGGIEHRQAEAHRRRQLVARELREELGAARQLTMAGSEDEVHRFTLRDAGVGDVQRDAVEEGQPSTNQRLDEPDLRLRTASPLTPCRP